MQYATPSIDPDAVAGRFGLAEDLPALQGDWHQHARPQLLYASQGALRLYAERLQVVLPPERAAWIPAGLPHRVSCGRPAHLRTVYLLPEDGGDEGLAVFSAPPLLREMVLQAAAWGPSPPEDPGVLPFLEALAHLARRWRAAPLALGLPAAQSPALAAALGLLEDRLARPVGLADAARAAGLSPRTLQRRCQDELGMPLGAWLHRARVARSLELLAIPHLSVGEIAVLVGYGSSAAYCRAFHDLLGSAPGAWRPGRGAD